MNITNQYDVFIAFHDSSRSSGALRQAESIYNYLQQQGIKCFLFPESSSSSVYKANFIKIMQSRLLLLVCNDTIARTRGGELDVTKNYHLYVELDSFFALTQSDEAFRSVNDAAILYFSENGQKTIVPSPEKLHALFDNRNSFHIATGTDDEDAFDDVLDWAQTRLETYETNDASGELMAILAGRVSDIFNRTIDGVNFRRVMRQATRIKCVGISNWTFTLTDGCTKLIRALNAEKDVEMLFLDPNGKNVALRAEEERKDTRGQVIASFDMLRSELHSHFKGQAEKLAHLKMYTFDMIPRDNLIFIYTPSDSFLFVQSYSHALPGSACPCMILRRAKNKESPLFEYYEGIYDNIKCDFKTRPLCMNEEGDRHGL